jgi:transposase
VKLLRASELTAVWVPDERHEAMRDLVRARDAAIKDYRIKRQNVSSLLLRLGRHYPGKKTWGRAHINWLTSLTLEHREQRIAFEEMLLAVRQVRERIERLEQAMREAVADWTLAPVIEAVQAMRGIDMVGAVAFLAELGDLSRFENPLQWRILASPPQRDRPERASSAAASPRLATPVHDGFSSRPRGATDSHRV